MVGWSVGLGELIVVYNLIFERDFNENLLFEEIKQDENSAEETTKG